MFKISFWPQWPGNVPLSVLESWPCSTDKRRLWRHRASTGWPTSSAATTSWWSPQEVNWIPTTLFLPTPCGSKSWSLASRRSWRSEHRPLVWKRWSTEFFSSVTVPSYPSCLTRTAQQWLQVFALFLSLSFAVSPVWTVTATRCSSCFSKGRNASVNTFTDGGSRRKP